MEQQKLTDKLSKQDERTLNSIFNPNLPYEEEIHLESVEEEDKAPSALQAEELELQGVKAAEQGDILAALDFFQQAIHIAPQKASAYNNHAQALRLKGDIEGAKQDLDKAIELSEGKGKAACQAYTQRAMIRRLEGENEEALKDFKKAAELGGKFAKEMCVALNPYAALCNQMLGEMIHNCRMGQM